MRVATNMSMLPTSQHTFGVIQILIGCHLDCWLLSLAKGYKYSSSRCSLLSGRRFSCRLNTGRAYPEFKNVLQKFGLRQNVFFQSKLARILDHVATPAGIHPNDQRIEDILNAPIPNCKNQLKNRFWN